MRSKLQTIDVERKPMNGKQNNFLATLYESINI